jgi:hypothetical protein
MAWPWLASLFSSQKTIDTVVDTAATLAKSAASGIDVIFYTDEEKSQARTKAFDQWLEQCKSIVDGDTPMAKARRAIAVMIVVQFLLFLNVGLYAVYTGAESVKGYIQANIGDLFWLVICVFGFYYGPYVYDRYIKK